MRQAIGIGIALLLTGCAHLGLAGPGEREREALWEQAHGAYAADEYERATSLFERIATEYPETGEGYESRFYLGALYLDPRNPAWDPGPAEAALDEYLSTPFDPYTEHHQQWPEARVLRELARQLNMPAEERVPGLQPETRTLTETKVVRVVAPAQETRALRAEIEQLRQQLAERERELERIRRTLTGKKP